MHRRRFVKEVSVGVVGAAFCGLTAGCSSLTYVQAAVEPGRLVVAKSDIADLPFAFVELHGSSRPIYLHRHGPDDFSAVSTRCTHKGCQVSPEGELLVCPCHGSEFTIDGKVVSSPAETDLQRFGVTTDEMNVYIQTG